MRRAALAALTVLAMAASGAPEAPSAAPPAPSPPILERLREFLTWIHPEGGECSNIENLRGLVIWDGGAHLGYSVGCPDPGPLEAVLRIREGEGVWQVAGGFEAASGAIERERGSPPGRPAEGESPEGTLRPPPGNAEVVGAATALDLLVPASVIEGNPPDRPEEFSRARLVGPVRVEVLVDVSPEGTPLRARSLRGPEPDLGTRRSAIEAVLKWRFRPAMLGRSAVRSFVAVPLSFEGLPAESSKWIHRALYRLEGLAGTDRGALERALRRARRGEDLSRAGAAAGNGWSSGSFAPGDWGIVPASDLPLPVRRLVHAAPVGTLAGPIEADGVHYAVRKRGEIYYAIRDVRSDEVSYKIVHQSRGPEHDRLVRAIERDVERYLNESRRAAFINEAARLMGIRQERVDLGPLVVHTDVLDRDEVQRLEQVINAAIGVHEEFWAPLAALRPIRQTVHVYAFRRNADHDRVRNLWRDGFRAGGGIPEDTGADAETEAPGWSRAGEYIPASRILSIPCEEMGGHLPVPILMHEAIHMLDFERVYPEGVQPAPWFEEGLATYYSFSHIDNRLRVQPGVVRRTGPIESGRILVQFDPREQLRRHLRRVEEEGPVGLRELLAAGPGDPLWSGGRAARAYGASWTLVHFLSHGEGGRYRPLFLQYARREAAGEGGVAAFERIFGEDLTALEAAWHEHEKRL